MHNMGPLNKAESSLDSEARPPRCPGRLTAANHRFLASSAFTVISLGPKGKWS